MVWLPFVGEIDVLNAIWGWLLSFPETLLNAITAIGYIFAYPAIVFVNLLLQDLNIIYTPFAGLINQIILIQTIPSQIFTLALPLPTEWTLIILIQIAISISVRGYRWINEFRSWIPTWGGGG